MDWVQLYFKIKVVGGIIVFGAIGLFLLAHLYVYLDDLRLIRKKNKK